MSLPTGLSVTTHNCATNRACPYFLARGLEDSTVACYSREAGYVTGHFGKYFNGHATGYPVPPP